MFTTRRHSSLPLHGLAGSRQMTTVFRRRRTTLGAITGPTAMRIANVADSRARLVVEQRMRFVPLRGLGDVTCTIDPTTGGRVCTSPAPGTTTTTPAPATNCTITPRYLPDPTQQYWDYNSSQPANWIFAGRPDANSAYDLYTRQDGGAWAAVTTGGGFMYNDPRRPGVAAYAPCPSSTPATTTTTQTDPATGATVPAPAPTSLPAPFVTTTAPAMPVSSPTPWAKYALYAGIGVAGLLAIKFLFKR